MKIEELKENQIYRNKRNHIITLNGKHVCYIDIPKDAIVHTTLQSVKTDDWELYVPQTQKIVEEEPKKRGRPKKNN